MRLNEKRIKEELAKIKRDVTWLAEELDMVPATLHYQLKNGTTKDADKIAGVLKITLNQILIDETKEHKQ